MVAFIIFRKNASKQQKSSVYLYVAHFYENNTFWWKRDVFANIRRNASKL